MVSFLIEQEEKRAREEEAHNPPPEPQALKSRPLNPRNP